MARRVGNRFVRAARCAITLLLLAAAWSGDASPPTAVPSATAAPLATAYVFNVGQDFVYAYSMKQDVAWESAGDKLVFTTTLLWKFALLPVTVTPERAELTIAILEVHASQSGPGGEHVVDSTQPGERSGRDDPLLGHLLELQGVVLTLEIDPRTGTVAEVRGGDEIVKRIDRRFPASFPGDPPPLQAQCRTAYGSAALARLWSAMLALPAAAGAVQTVPLGPPLEGAVERHWQDAGYTVKLPAGIDHLDAQLLKDPTPVRAVLSALEGSGAVTLKNGAPDLAKGDLRFTLTLNALTQPVVQRHHLVWQLQRVISR